MKDISIIFFCLGVIGFVGGAFADKDPRFQEWRKTHPIPHSWIEYYLTP